MNPQLKPPPYIPDPNPTGIDKAIATIQDQLTNLFGFNSLGRVYPQVKDGKREPWIYRGEGDYYLAYPNDELTAFSCLYPHDDERLTEEGILGTRTVSVIVWNNQQANNQTTPSVERLKTDVVNQLSRLTCILEFRGSIDSNAIGARGIYPGFDLTGLEEKFLTYPFGAFRLEIIVKYANLCRR